MCSPLETGGKWLAMVVRMPVERGLNTNPIRWFTTCQKKKQRNPSNDCLSTSSAADMFIYS